MREVWEDLKGFSIGYLMVGKELVHQVGEPTETQSKILALLGIKADKGNYFKMLCSE